MKRSLAAMVCFIAAASLILVVTASAKAESQNFDPNMTLTVDRTAPGTYGPTTFQGVDVYQEGYGSGPTGTFYCYQGMGASLSWSSPTVQTYTVGMYVPASWTQQNVNAGVWFTCNDLATNSTYDGNNSSILAYISGTSATAGAGFYNYNDTAGWQLVASSIGTDQWHTLTFQFDQTTQIMSYSVDGSLVGTQTAAAFGARGEIYGMSCLILDCKNYGTDDPYTVNYSAPEPATLSLLVIGGLAALRRKNNK